MTFSDYLKTLSKYYSSYIDPSKLTRFVSINSEKFVRTIFIAASLHKEDLFMDCYSSLLQKLYYGSRNISKNLARKILPYLDKEGFIEFLSTLESDDAYALLCNDFDIKADDKQVVYEYIYNCFVQYLENALNKKPSINKK